MQEKKSEERKDLLKHEKDFKRKVKARLKDKGLMNINYFKEYIENHNNPNVILGSSNITKETAITIINSVITDYEIDQMASKAAKGY